MVDTRVYSRCAKHTDKSDKTEDDVTENNNNNDNDVHMTVESLIESELRKLTEERKSDPGPETVKESDEPVKIVTHPDYDSSSDTKTDNIALWKLSSPVSTDTYTRLCLPSQVDVTIMSLMS